MKHYLLNVIQPAGGTIEPDALRKIMNDVEALREEMQAAGVWVFSGGLAAPDTATVVHYSDDGELLTTDGPFAEGKEYVGGFTILRAEDLDAALYWAEKTTRATTLAIEVRPFHNAD